MKVVIQGTKGFDTYELFLRGMHHVILNRAEGDNEIIFYAGGTANINDMLLGFVNITEKTMKSNGVKAKIVRLPPSEIKKKILEVDKVLFFCRPKEPISPLIKYFQDKDPETTSDFVSIWRF